MKNISNMTVQNLKDIVKSQLCVYGDKALFVRNMDGQESFQLFAGKTNILDCLSYEETETSCCGLLMLAETLEPLNENEQILCSSELFELKGFQIGFKSSVDGFVETINSKELTANTIVNEWSGSPCPVDPDNFWIKDTTGERIQA